MYEFEGVLEKCRAYITCYTVLEPRSRRQDPASNSRWFQCSVENEEGPLFRLRVGRRSVVWVRPAYAF
jgi:hypothetical protein